MARLEQELNQANSKITILEGKGTSNNALSEELCEVRSQLVQKSALLDKVKLLLQRAAAREKALQEEVSESSCSMRMNKWNKSSGFRLIKLYPFVFRSMI